METWRVIAAAVVGTGGLLAVLVAMAQVRDSAVGISPSRMPSTRTRVAAAAGIGLGLLVVALLLVLTVLPATIVWALAAALWLVLFALFLVG